MKLLLRLGTVLCYFLPCTFFFTTCHNGMELRMSYNRAEARQNILLEEAAAVQESSDTVRLDSSLEPAPNLVDSGARPVLLNTSTISDDSLFHSSVGDSGLLHRIILPTDTSLSGIGAILYFKNLTGQIAIALSLLLSLVLLIAFKWLKSRKLQLYLLSTAAVGLTMFIIDSFVSCVTLLWGCWILFLLLLLQLVLEWFEVVKEKN